MLTFCFFAFCAPGRHGGRRNRMAEGGVRSEERREKREECRGRCSHRPAAHGNVPGRDKAAKAPQASQARPAPHVVGSLFARAVPARKPPRTAGRWPSETRPEGLLPPCRCLTTQKSAALFPKSGTSLFKSVQNKKPKITRDAAPQTAIITTAARMGGSHCRARPG